MSPGFFSFNVSGGRCETCKGLGRVVEDLSFLGEVAIYCPSCEGRRFKDSVLEVTYRGKNLLDILALNISEARELFFDEPAITTALDQAISLGLGYLTLGQSTNSFSGGEAQRIKLLGLLKGHRNMKPQVLIFDEPTTGLSDRDVQSLLKQFRNLTELGNTLVVIEHHLGVIGSADWLVEIGPEAAAKGGEVLYEGAPRNLGTAKRSATAGFLKNLWEEENQYESL